MSPKAQRIAIAEACGWKRCGEPEPNWLWQPPESARRLYMTCELPDYCGSLDAMHKAEKSTLDGDADAWRAYLDYELSALCERADNPVECATAKQRAEALLRALDKWDDNK